MKNSELINLSDCITVPCKLSIREFVKNESNEISKYEVWEYERIMKQMKDCNKDFEWNFNEDKDKPEEIKSKVLAPIVIEKPELFSDENSSEWQKIAWENNVVTDNMEFKSTLEYCLPQLSLTILKKFESTENEIDRLPIRFPRILRRTIFDYYPVCINQNSYFLDMDRRFFPIITFENDSISKSLQNISGFISVCNGERRNYNNNNDNTDLNSSISSKTGRLFLYESSEQHSPFRMQPVLASLLVAYSNKSNDINNNLGVLKQTQRKSPFFGALSDNIPYQLALENQFFRVPVFQHSIKPTDFLLILNGNRMRIRRFDGLLLSGKQMPLMKINNPKSDFFRKLMMRVVVQLFIDMELVPVDLLASLLSNLDFLKIEGDLHKIAMLTSDKKFWKLKSQEQSRQSLLENKGFYGNIEIEDYMIWSSILSYLNSYDYVQSDKSSRKTVKNEKKKSHKNSCSPWSISKSYLNGIHKGYWKLINFEEPTKKNQMDSFTFVKTLVPKKKYCKADLRRLTVHETNRLLKHFQLSNATGKIKKLKRWALVNELSTLAATDMGGNTDMEKYARDNTTNRPLLRKKYIKQCQEIFESNRNVLTNPNELESENECADDILKAESKEITIEEIRKYIQELNSNSKKNEVLPVIRNPENVKKFIENPLKQFVIYRKKEGVVKKEIYPVNDYILTYLKHAKSGRFGKKLYGIGDSTKKEKQQLRDKLRRQEKYKKKRLDMNLPIDINSQDTTDKVCSSCGRKGHIRTNQECPNFDKPFNLIKQESNNSCKSSKSVLTKSKVLKHESLISNTENKSPINKPDENKIMRPVKRNSKQINVGNSAKRLKLEPSISNTEHEDSNKNYNNQKSVTPMKRSMKQLKEKYFSTIKRQRLNTLQPTNKEAIENETQDSEDDEFIIDIPNKFITKKPTSQRKPRQRKSVVRKEIPECPALVAPFGNEPIIFQSSDTIPLDIESIQTSSDDECKRKFDSSLWSINESKVKIPSDSESDEYNVTFPVDEWNRALQVRGEKENVSQDVDTIYSNNYTLVDISESYIDNNNINNLMEDDDEDDDEFTFQKFPK